MKSDEFRVLVDQLWPRGISRANVERNLWLPEIGPSTKLRQWFNYDPTEWREFQRRYHAKLKDQNELVTELKGRAKKAMVTLLFSAKDKQHNQAVAQQS